ncbi:unnamed protein product [Musa acuminata var. zebrina]
MMMGRDWTKTVKKSLRQEIQRYYSRATLDFYINKKILSEERERRMDFVPDESPIKVEHIVVNKETLYMLASLTMADLPGVDSGLVPPPRPFPPLSELAFPVSARLQSPFWRAI